MDEGGLSGAYRPPARPVKEGRRAGTRLRARGDGLRGARGSPDPRLTRLIPTKVAGSRRAWDGSPRPRAARGDATRGRGRRGASADLGVGAQRRRRWWRRLGLARLRGARRLLLRLQLRLDALEDGGLLQRALVEDAADVPDLVVDAGDPELLEGVHPAVRLLDLLADLAQARLGGGHVDHGLHELAELRGGLQG